MGTVMDNGQPTTDDIHVERLIKASPTQVWSAWRDPSLLARWFAPEPVKTEVVELDLRPGGAFHTKMKLPDGQEFGGAACFLDVIENERIVFTDCLAPGFRPSPEPFFTAVITLTEHDGGTLYQATALHKDADDRQRHLDMGFERGWAQCLEQLANLVEASQ